MIARLARSSFHHRRLVTAAWLAALIAITVIAGSVGSNWSLDFRLNGSDSQAATDVLAERFPAQAGAAADIVFKADAGVDDPAVRDRLDTLFAAVGDLDEVAQVVSPFDADVGGGGADQQISGDIGYAQIDLTVETPSEATTGQLAELIAAADTDGLQVEGGGYVFETQSAVSSELIGIIAAVFILLIAFGSLLAMGLPLLTALIGIGIGVSTVGILSHITSIPEIGPTVAVMIGLGVGIDYALFIVTRYREGFHDGLDPETATLTALDTAGRAVMFAGATVVISLLGMLLMGISFIGGLGVAAAAVVLVVMIASITLLPALLGFTGTNIDKLRIPGIGKKRDPRTTAGYRWGHFLQRHPWPFALLGLVVLLTLAIPVFSIRLGASDDGNLPTSQTVRRAYDLKAEGFGPGASGPLLLATEINDPADLTTLDDLTTVLAETPGVAQVSPVISNEPGDAAIIQVTPTNSAQDEETSQLIRDLRNEVIPSVTDGTGVDVHIGGLTAAYDDISTILTSRLPLFIGTVLTLSFLLLMLVFRSLLVPLKAVVMNLLSIGAAYGLLVAVFQWGWGADLIGVGQEGPIESFVPVMMFAILFGLSMDYEVFLLSRIKEEYQTNGNDNREAVANGLAATARVITAAAAIMVFVFGGFLFADDRVVKEFGLGLSAAILIDATIVRMILVPATMELLGKANWWFPKWLRWLPSLDLEHSDSDSDTVSDTDTKTDSDADTETAPTEVSTPVNV